MFQVGETAKALKRTELLEFENSKLGLRDPDDVTGPWHGKGCRAEYGVWGLA